VTLCQHLHNSETVCDTPLSCEWYYHGLVGHTQLRAISNTSTLQPEGHQPELIAIKIKHNDAAVTSTIPLFNNNMDASKNAATPGNSTVTQ
jgi:hypothetical protein